MKKVLRFRIAASGVFLLSLATAIAAHAQTLQSLASFDGTDGTNPFASVVQGIDGNFYGTTGYGGANNNAGTVFKITSGGTLTSVFSFDSTDGSVPTVGLVQASDGNLYGTTYYGGDSACDYPYGCGTVFKLTPGGTLTTLYSFSGSDGSHPYAGLVQARDGNFYGTTRYDGANGDGTVFKITSVGTLTVLHSFDSTDGAFPSAELVQGTDGNFYGTTYEGGLNGYGTVFQITAMGTLTVLHSFDSTDGAYPYAGLVQANDGSFYGTTQAGGTYSYGTVFKITSVGTLNTLYSFCVQTNCADGESPFAGLVQATDRNFYSTTAGGGAYGFGTVFKISSGGALTTLHSFDATDGSGPQAALVQGTNGDLYGTTYNGGIDNVGTVFSLSVGLGPFVQTLPTVGKAGTHVIILGNALTGATSVTFNGTAATFTVVSPTEIKATVPIGATSGKVQLTTPHGTLTSNVAFRVKQ